MSEQGQIEEIEDYIAQEQIFRKGTLFPRRTSDVAPTYIQSINSIIFKTRQVLKCPICDKRLFRPYVLPCSHRFCLRCWQKNKDTFKIVCPRCKRQTNRNQVLADKTLPIILKLFQEMLDIKQRQEQIIDRQLLKRKGQPHLEQQRARKRFKCNEPTLIQLEDEKQKQIQAKKQINVYSTRMKVNKFYHNQLSVGQFQIVMDIVEGKSKDSFNQAQSVTSDPKTPQVNSPQASSKASHPQQLSSGRNPPQEGQLSIAKRISHRTIQSNEQSVLSETQSVQYQRIHKEKDKSRKKHIKRLNEDRKIEVKSNEQKVELQRQKNLNIGKEERKRRQFLSLSHQQINKSTQQHSGQFLSQSFNDRSSSQRKVQYLKLKIQKYPGNTITPNLSFNQILCPQNKKVGFIQSLVASQMGCCPSQVFLFQNNEGVMKSITPQQQIHSLFTQARHFSRKSMLDWQFLLDEFNKQTSNNRNKLSKIKRQGTIYFRVMLQSE